MTEYIRRERMADEYIRRDAAMKAVASQYGACRSPAQNRLLDEIRNKIRRVPSADVAEVALPCKVGDTVWVTDARVIGRWMPEQLSQPDAAVILRTYIDKDGKYLFETERYTFERGIIGKAVFLTREEAERAMEGTP